MKAQIKEFYDNNRCYADPRVCGESRTKISDGEYFPSPYPFIGENYNAPQIAGQAVPKIFILSVNQNLKHLEEKIKGEAEARYSLYPTDKKELTGHWYGPLPLAISLADIFYSLHQNQKQYNFNFSPNGNDVILENIAYSNCVRCGTGKKPGTPTEQMVKNCKKFTEYEITTLEPDLIFCIGREPFCQIKNINTFQSESITDDCYYQVKVNKKTIKVIYFYHYGNQSSIMHRYKENKKITTLSKLYQNGDISKQDVSELLKPFSRLWRDTRPSYAEISKFFAISVINKILD